MKNPIVRNDVDIVRMEGEEFVLRDPSTGRVFKFTSVERFLIHNMDGTHTAKALRDVFVKRFEARLSVRHVEEFIEQLRVNGLLVGESRIPVHSHGKRKLEPGTDRWVNPFFDLMVMAFGFIVHPIWAYFAFVLAASVGIVLVQHVGELYDELRVLAIGLDIPLILIIVVLKVGISDLLRSMVRGIICRRYRGRIHYWGLRWIRHMIPYVSCDVGGSYFKMGKRGQQALLWSGISFQLALCAAAGWGWFLTRTDSYPHTFFLLLLVPSTVSLLLYVNPLMRLDAYAILSSKTGVKDLYRRSRREARSWLTLRRAPEALAVYSRGWVRFYGIATYVWNDALGLGVAGWLLWYMTWRFEGVGALAAGAAILLWFATDIRRAFLKMEPFNRIIRFGGKWYVRYPLRIAILAGIVYAGMLPYDYSVSGECQILPVAQYGVRAQITDEIVAIHVEDGDLVELGQLIATLSGRDTSANLATTRAELDKAYANYALMQKGSLPEEIAVLEREVEVLEIELDFQNIEVRRKQQMWAEEISSEEQYDQQKRLRDSTEKKLAGARQKLERVKIGFREEEIDASRSEVDRLRALVDFHESQHALIELRAPAAGRIAHPHLKEQIGQVVQEGELVCVVRDDRLVAVVDADEVAISQVSEGMSAQVRLRGFGGEAFSGTVVRREFSARRGGDLVDYSVRSDRELLIQRNENGNDGSHFRVFVELDEIPEGLVPGTTGYAKIVIEREQLWQSLLRPIERFIRVEVWSWLP